MKKKNVIAMFGMMLVAATATTVVTGCGSDSATENSSDVADSSDAQEAAEVEIAEYDPMDYVTLGDYKNLDVEYVIPAEVTDEDVQEDISYTLDENTEYEDVTDRGVESGDFVDIDFTGTVDGEEFDGGSSEGYELEIGSGDFIEGFEDQLIGAQTGDSLDVTVTFPDDYDDETLAGKEAVFAVTINSIYLKTVPEYNDEFVKTVSETSTTTAEYEEEVKAKLEAENMESAKSTAEEEVLAAAVENATVDGYPDDLYQACYDSTVASYESYAEMFGLELDDFLSEYMDMDEDDLDELTVEWVNEIMVVKAIVKDAGLEMDDDTYSEKLDALAAEYDYESGEEFEADYSSFSIEADILRTEVMEYLYENANVTELTEAEYNEKYDIEEEDATEEDAAEEDTTEDATEDTDDSASDTE